MRLQTAFLCLGLLASPAFGQIPGLGNPFARPAAPERNFGDSRDVVEVRVVAAADAVRPGGDLPVAIELSIDPGWHLWTNEGSTLEGAVEFEGAIRTAIKVTAAAGLEVHEGFMAWPEPHLISADLGEGPQSYAVFEGRSVVYLPVTVAADAKDGSVELDFTIDFQACDDQTCLAPATVKIALPIAIAADAAGGGEANALFANFDPSVFGRIRSGEKAPEIVDFDAFGLKLSVDIRGAGFLLLLLLAAIGGLLLNFTPCVLPVIPLKIMALSQAAGNRGRCFLLGLAMSLGVIAFWLGLGIAVASISGFTATNQLFQSPIFTISVGVVIAVLAIGMMGLFSVRLPQAALHDRAAARHRDRLVRLRHHDRGALDPVHGALHGLCGGLGGDRDDRDGAARLRRRGAGNGLPLPRARGVPGARQEHAADRPSERSHQAGDGTAAACGGGVLRRRRPQRPHGRTADAALAGVLVGGRPRRGRGRTPDDGSDLPHHAAGRAADRLRRTRCADPRGVAPRRGSHDRQGPDRLDLLHARAPRRAQRDGEVVVLDFTAEWCLNCKTLEATVLATKEVAAALNGDGVVAMKVDLTGNNEAGNTLLRESGA